MHRCRVLRRTIAELRVAAEQNHFCVTHVHQAVKETNIASLPVHDASFLLKYYLQTDSAADGEHFGSLFQDYFRDHARQLHPHQIETFLQGLAHFSQLKQAFQTSEDVRALLPFISALSPNALFTCVRAMACAKVDAPMKFYQESTQKVLHAWRKGVFPNGLNECVHLLSLIETSNTSRVHWREVSDLFGKLNDEAWPKFAKQLPTTYVLDLLKLFHRVALDQEEILLERFVFDVLQELGLEARKASKLTVIEEARMVEAIAFCGGHVPFIARPTMTPPPYSSSTASTSRSSDLSAGLNSSPCSPSSSSTSPAPHDAHNDPPMSARITLALLWAPLVSGPMDTAWREAAKAFLKEDLSSLKSWRRLLMLRQVRQELGAPPAGSASLGKRSASRKLGHWCKQYKLDLSQRRLWSKADSFLDGKDYMPLGEFRKTHGLTGFERIEARHVQADGKLEILLVRSDATRQIIRDIRDNVEGFKGPELSAGNNSGDAVRLDVSKERADCGDQKTDSGDAVRLDASKERMNCGDRKTNSGDAVRLDAPKESELR